MITIDEAFQSLEWTQASQQEYDALLKSYTWELVPLPANKTSVGCKGPFKVKRQVDGSIARHKRRLRQVDINNAFLNGILIEVTYMDQPPSFEKSCGDQKLVCKLKKALYGLKQAPRAWFDKLKDFLLSAACSLKDLGLSNFFLGIEVKYTIEGLFLSQHKYIMELLQKCHMDQANGSPTPMQPLDLHSKAIKRILKILMIEDQLLGIVYSLRSIQSHGVQRNKKLLVSRFTAEAEYKSIANATADILWLESLLSG
ncbi:putative LRR receptor-like serine/threonine-protein kinase [Gossypium australe]|uniref:Putative LRR receptor-like serine/threonine-protein kinase n=1 Tax=Gossypium australe TaxID=47621 RepID=A0A5B6VNZ3_9ROSI|nr:putative LRR receptor-like serine/threonine-protein kinase [Gossypium australe]